MSTLEWIAAIILITCAAVGLAWWLGGQRGKDRIDELKERLKFARAQCNDIETRLSDLKDQMAIQEELISKLLSNSDPASECAEELARGNTKIQNALTSLINSANYLGNTLIIVRSMRSRKRRFFRS